MNEIKEDMTTNRRADQEDLKEMMKEIMNATQAKMNAKRKEMRE
jgi:hypothetical protein